MRGGQYRWLVVFVSLCIWTGFLSLRVRDSSDSFAMSDREEEAGKGGGERNNFVGIHYYYLLRGEREKRFHLRADELLNNGVGGETVFHNPVGTILLNGGRTLSYKGGRGRFEPRREELHLVEDVSFSQEDSKMACSEAVYSTGSKELRLVGNVSGTIRLNQQESTVRIDSGEAWAQPLTGKVRYLGGVKGNLESPRDQGDKLFFASKELDIDLHRDHLYASKEVTFRRDRFVAGGNRGEIFWNRKKNNIEHYVLQDNVLLKEKVADKGRGGFIERLAFAEKMEGSFGDNRLTLTGRPRVAQGEDVIKGDKIILKKDSKMLEVHMANGNFRLR